MTQEETANYVVLFILVGALIVGALSMLFGKILEVWYTFSDWWDEGIEKAIHYRIGGDQRITMSSSATNHPRTTHEPLDRAAVRSDTNADRTSSDDENEPVHEPADEPDIISSVRANSDAEIIAWMSVQRTPDGKYRFTANKIYQAVGGTRQDVLDMISELRGAKKQPPARAIRKNASGEWEPAK